MVMVLIFITGFSAGNPDDRVVAASKILDEIKFGEPVEYDGFTIVGDLDLDKLDDLPSVNEGLFYKDRHTNLSEIKKSVESLIKITNSTIKGWVNFNNTIFNKPLDLGNTKLEGHAGFRGAVFKEDADLSNTQFRRYADFLGSVFGKSAYFNGTQFLDYADFEGAHFDNYANFGSKFIDIADFKFAHFNGYADFEGARFNDDAYFGGAGFNNRADFQYARFNDDADFNEIYYLMDTGGFGDKCTEFNGYTDFEYAEFNSIAGFEGAKFKYIALFREAKFNRSVTFRGAEFNYSADFAGTQFNGDANFESTIQKSTLFRNASFNSSADFSGAELRGWSSFIDTKFNETDFSYVQFFGIANFGGARYANEAIYDGALFKDDALFENVIFERRLSLSKAKYNKLYLRWDSLREGLAYDDTAYMSLMKNFKDLGYYEDYDNCYYHYRVAHRAVPWPSVPDWEEAVRKAIDYPLEWFYGYGTKPFNAFFISLFIVVAFAAFWWAVGLGGPKDKTRASLKDGDDWLDSGITDILGYSFTVFLSGTKFFIDPPAIPRIDGLSRSIIKWAFIIERTLGALFSVMFFIAISGTIVRAT